MRGTHLQKPTKHTYYRIRHYSKTTTTKVKFIHQTRLLQVITNFMEEEMMNAATLAALSLLSAQDLSLERKR